MKLELSLINLLMLTFLIMLQAGCDSKQDIETHMRNAQLYEKENKHNAVVIELKNVLQRDPNHKDARLLLGKTYLKVGDGVSAEKELSRAMELGVSGEEVVLSLMSAKLMQRKYDDVLEKVSTSDSWPAAQKMKAVVYQGDAYLGQGKVNDAMMSYQRALELDNNSSSAKLGLAKVALSQKNYSEVQTHIDSIADEDENAVEMYVIKAELARQKAELEEAEKNYIKAMELSKQRGQMTTSLNIQSQLVPVLIANKKIDVALENVTQLQKAAPNNPMVIYLRGLIAYLQKDYDIAQDSMQQVLSKIPEHLPATLVLGAANYAKGNYQQANKLLTTFVNKVPTHIHARKLLGMVRLKLDKPEEAVEVLKSASQTEQQGDAQLLAIIGRAATESGDARLGIDYLKQAKKAQPENASIRSELARVYMSQGAYDKAISELESIQGEGKNKAKVLLVYTHLRKEDFTQARKVASELLKEEPDNPAWQVVAGGVEMLAGDRLKARKFFNKALEIKKDFALARINIARMEFEEGNLKEAKEQFKDILASDDKNITALLGMAQVAEKSGDMEQAVSWLEKARVADEKAVLPRVVLGRYYFRTGKFTNSLEVAKEAAEVKGSDVGVLRLMAASLIKLDRASEALDAYKQLISSDPKNPRWHFEIANIHRGMKSNSQATSALKKALALDKNFLPAKAVLVELDIQSNNLELAQKAANAIIKQHPKSSAGYLLLGDVYTKQKNLQQAQKTYIDGYNVNASRVLVNKIFLLSNALKNYDTSIKITQDWLKSNPDDAAALMYLGLAYQEQGKIDLAKAQYAGILEKQPKNIMALNNMAFLLAEKESAKALDYAEQARTLAPDNFAILDTYGWVLLKSGKHQEALDILKNASDKSNGNPSVRYHYAVALSKNNQSAKAKSILSEITQANKPFPELAAAEKLIKELN